MLHYVTENGNALAVTWGDYSAATRARRFGWTGSAGGLAGAAATSAVAGAAGGAVVGLAGLFTWCIYFFVHLRWGAEEGGERNLFLSMPFVWRILFQTLFFFVFSALIN